MTGRSSLYSLTNFELKKLIKAYKINVHISKLRKKDLVNHIERYYASKKIQRFIRTKLGISQICPITLEPVRYPLFAYKLQNNKFIYYNLQQLSDFLVTTGDFRDPKTRLPYSEQILMKIDLEMTRNKLRVCEPKLKSVFLASRNKAYYIKKKQHEESIITLNWLLDENIIFLRDYILYNHNVDRLEEIKRNIYALIRQLCSRSRSDSLIFIKKAVGYINDQVNEMSSEESKLKRDEVIAFLFYVEYRQL